MAFHFLKNVKNYQYIDSILLNLTFITSVNKNYYVIYADAIQLFYSEKKTKAVIESG